MRLLAILAALSYLLAASGKLPMLYELEPVDHSAVVCGCTFNQSIPGATEGSYGSGPEILLIDQNATPPTIQVNLGDGNLTLGIDPSTKYRQYDCAQGERWITSWRGPLVDLRAELSVIDPGYESCWFSGVVEVSRGSESWSAPVKGACGC